LHVPGPPPSVWHWTILSYELINFPVMNAGSLLFRWRRHRSARADAFRWPATKRRVRLKGLRRADILPFNSGERLIFLKIQHPILAWPQSSRRAHRKPQSSSGAETFLTQVFYRSSILPIEQPNSLFITAEITPLRRYHFSDRFLEISPVTEIKPVQVYGIWCLVIVAVYLVIDGHAIPVLLFPVIFFVI